MDLAPALAKYTGLTIEDLFNGPSGPLAEICYADGKHYVRKWTISNVPQPSPTQIETWFAAPDPSALMAHASSACRAVREKGCMFSLPERASGKAASVLCDATAETLADLGALARFGAANPTASRQWVDNHGEITSLVGQQFVDLDAAVSTWRSALEEALANVRTRILIGDITAPAEIAALTWPMP